jgi:transposase
VEIILEPTNKLDTDRCIGEISTEFLEQKPSIFYVANIRRMKYIDDSTQEIKIAELPRPIAKTQFGPGFMSQAISAKYLTHMPYYRLVQQYKREASIDISRASLGESAQLYIDLIKPLGEALRKEALSQDYLQVDETPFKVQSEEKKGTTHLGYIWAARNPTHNIVLFTYNRGRGIADLKAHLGDFKGMIQSDGYHAYSGYVHSESHITFNCWAHARRYFKQALDNHADVANEILNYIQQLYAIERHAKENQYSFDQRKQIRQEQSKPILQNIKTRLDQLSESNILPSTALGKAIAYTLKFWPNLIRYVDYGFVEIDNNLIENSIRPIALGRKNYLFAGSHDSAQRSAMMYSLFGTCILNGVNPTEWLLDVFNRIKDHPINKIHELLPYNWKPLMQ